jgi:pimeloyl-ACP methyl ester carboxylesterase
LNVLAQAARRSLRTLRQSRRSTRLKSIRIPILKVYGLGGAAVPKERSERMARAAHDAGKSDTVVTLPGESHCESRSHTRLQVWRKLESSPKDHL